MASSSYERLGKCRQKHIKAKKNTSVVELTSTNIVMCLKFEIITFWRLVETITFALPILIQSLVTNKESFYFGHYLEGNCNHSRVSARLAASASASELDKRSEKTASPGRRCQSRWEVSSASSTLVRILSRRFQVDLVSRQGNEESYPVGMSVGVPHVCISYIDLER